MKKLRQIIRIAAPVVVLVFILLFVFRNQLLHLGIEKVSNKIKSRYGYSLSISQASIVGISEVHLKGVELSSANSDTLFRIDTLNCKFRLLPILRLKPRLSELFLGSGSVSLNKQLLFPEKSNVETTDSLKSNTNIASGISSLVNKIFDNLPSSFQLRNLGIRYQADSSNYGLEILNIKLNDEKMEGIAGAEGNFWSLNGTADISHRKSNLKIFPLQQKKLPYLKSRFGLELAFDTLNLRTDKIDFSDGEFSVQCYGAAKNFVVNHAKLSSSEVITDYADANLILTAGSDFIQLDSMSTLRYNAFVLHPFIRYSTNPKRYQLLMRSEELSANSFFASLPAGLFSHLKGLKAKGNIKYEFDFDLQDKNPEAVVFDSRLISKNFSIQKYGSTNLALMNTAFTHTPYETIRASRTFVVGETNPNFYYLSNIPDYLKNSILTSEDPSFFRHNGFIEDAIRESIAKNYRKGKFVRGASTISMQLVKNVFLTREKTIARKMEEALMVWMIERHRISTKERMFEVYLNIIEWGPGVYGVGEAARFYFRKTPMQLTLPECIFLASIIPHPKTFYYCFDGNGNMRTYMHAYFNLLAGKMVFRELVSQADTFGLIPPKVIVTGPAKSYILKSPPDSLVTDSLDFLD